MGPRKFISRLVRGRRKSSKPGDLASAGIGDADCSPGVRCRTLAALAAAYEREKHDAEFVRRQLPMRIDELLLTEIGCSFEHSLCELICHSASKAAGGSDSEAALAARGTLLEAAGCAATALEGLEARLNARSGVACGEYVTPLDDTSRGKLLGDFAEQLAAGVAAAVPRILRMATQVGAVELRDEANRQLPCMRESWESIVQCKTQITDLFLDNDEVAMERQNFLFREAVELMEVEEGLPELGASELPDVIKFLSVAIQSYPPTCSHRMRAMSRLNALLCPEEQPEMGELEQVWRSLAEKVLTIVAEAKLEVTAEPLLDSIAASKVDSDISDGEWVNGIHGHHQDNH
mmetsp:Transcript_52230/g.135190  ORF Transcript_52230/g.135190 Transcript_52230/m.135190 type:complete len:348 (+) Transcript_52230:2-1045(+)